MKTVQSIITTQLSNILISPATFQTNPKTNPSFKMRFFAITALFGAVAVAAETATVTDLSIRDNNGIQSASFKVAGVECSSTDAAVFTNNEAVVCGESAYRFRLQGSNSKYDLTLYKQTGTA